MKKKKFLATILIVSSAFLGTGYSWWTDGLQVGEVVSTGEFKVVGVPSNLSKYTRNTIESKGVQDIKSFSYDMKDLFPGKKYTFGAEFKNEGSVVAAVDFVKVEPQVVIDDETQKYITIKGAVKIVGNAGVMRSETLNTTIKDLQTDLQNKIKNWELRPEQSLVLVEWEVALPTKFAQTASINYGSGYAEKYENKCEGKNASFNLKIAFKQYNQQ